MSHGGMTDPTLAAYIRQKERTVMDQYHAELRTGQLDQEFDQFKHYNVTFTSPNGLKQFTLSMGELFEMFELQRQKKNA